MHKKANHLTQIKLFIARDFPLSGSSPWGQDLVRDDMSFGLKLFIGYLDRGKKLDQLLSKDRRSNPYFGVTRGQKCHMLSYEQKCFIVYFKRGVKVKSTLVKGLQVMTCQFMLFHVRLSHVIITDNDPEAVIPSPSSS